MWLMRRAIAGGSRTLEIVPCRSPVRRERFPFVDDASCMAAMQLVLPDGHVLSGADAVPEILRRIPRWGWMATLLALPGIRPFARQVYGWIARNRMRLSCRLRPRE
jgi:predicted DCC family thiol-disulfide oxidoreductase YuxK